MIKVAFLSGYASCWPIETHLKCKCAEYCFKNVTKI